jgi:hypothetical protein
VPQASGGADPKPLVPPGSARCCPNESTNPPIAANGASKPNVLDLFVRVSTFATSAAVSPATWLRSSCASPSSSR